MFYISQIDRVLGGEIAAKDRVDGMMYVTKYHSKGNNIPINATLMENIYPAEQEDELKVPGSNATPTVTYPTIHFEGNENTYIWYYPPTESGARKRNSDFAFIMKNEGLICPG